METEEIGTIEVGKSADLAVWDLPHEAAILQPWGTARVRETITAA